MSTQWTEYRRPLTNETTAGWLRNGRIHPGQLLGGDFWTQTARVVIAGMGKPLDTVHSYTGSVVAGPFDASVENGDLASLLSAMPPHLLEEHLGDVFAMSGLGLRTTSPAAFTVGIRAAKSDVVKAVMREDREVERMWVEGIGDLLSNVASIRSLGRAYRERIQKQSIDALEERYSIRNHTVPISADLRACVATFLAFAVEDENGAVILSRQSGPSAYAMLDKASSPGPWPASFASKTGRIRSALDREVW